MVGRHVTAAGALAQMVGEFVELREHGEPKEECVE
jgi:hypothetical protein